MTTFDALQLLMNGVADIIKTSTFEEFANQIHLDMLINKCQRESKGTPCHKCCVPNKYCTLAYDSEIEAQLTKILNCIKKYDIGDLKEFFVRLKVLKVPLGTKQGRKNLAHLAYLVDQNNEKTVDEETVDEETVILGFRG